MAFVAEPLVGAMLGAVPAVDGYFKRIREICDQYGVLLILDEVMCGMGRTGHLFACEADGVTPDILFIAKGLGAGYQPIGAMLCTDTIYETIESGSGFSQHGHTYQDHPVATATGLGVVQKLLDQDLITRSALQAEKLSHALQQDIFDPSLKLAANIKSTAFDLGLICYPMAGTRDGKSGDHILLAPPFIIEDTQIDELTDKLKKSIEKCLP